MQIGRIGQFAWPERVLQGKECCHAQAKKADYIKHWTEIGIATTKNVIGGNQERLVSAKA
jgi:hypothetical protein